MFFQQIYTDGDSKTTHKAMMLDGMQTIAYGSNCPGTRMIGTSYPHSYNGLGLCVFCPGHSGVLDDQKVWGDDGSMPGIAYIDSQDVSRMMASAMIKDRD